MATTSKPYRLNIPSEGLNYSNVVVEVVQAAKRHPEGVEIKVGEELFVFRPAFMMADLMRFWRATDTGVQEDTKLRVKEKESPPPAPPVKASKTKTKATKPTKRDTGKSKKK